MIQNVFVLKMYFVSDRNEVVTIGGPKMPHCLKKRTSSCVENFQTKKNLKDIWNSFERIQSINKS